MAVALKSFDATCLPVGQWIVLTRRFRVRLVTEMGHPLLMFSSSELTSAFLDLQFVEHCWTLEVRLVSGDGVFATREK